MNLSSKEALTKINGWVSEKTEHMIEEFLQEAPSEDVQMILLNAVYFKGEWKEQFDKEDTVREKFYGKDKTSEIDLMCQYDKKYRYIETDGIKAIELPYENENIVMDILLPLSEDGDIHKIFSKLSEKKKSNIFKKLSKTEPEQIASVIVPKFEIEYGVQEITNHLKSLGMNRAFDSQTAEFSKISSGLYAGAVFHKAKIEVDEEGTQAAAATEVQMRKITCAVGEKLFIADQPFLFVVRDKANDMILFMGSVQNLGE